jgi:nicotinate-nucleotide adenylyltransferase
MTRSETPATVIGLFGGSFDPVHTGHVALARSAQVALKLTHMRLLPSGNSWQKPDQKTPAHHRLAMLRLALANEPNWQVDDQEIVRGGNTYTVETLEALRAELGNQVSLVLMMGSDQLHNLASWHRYEDILKFAHIAVTQREQVRLQDFAPAIEQLLTDHGTDALPDAAAGSIVFFRMPAVAVSSTRLRAALNANEPVEGLLAPAVLDYIHEHRLYQSPQ